MRHKFIQENVTWVKVDWMIKGCSVHLKGSTRDHLLDFFLCVFFTFFLSPGVMLQQFSCTFLTCAGCMQVRCLSPVWESSWDATSTGRELPRMTTFLVLASCMFGFGARAPMGTFPRWMLTAHALPCDNSLGRGASPCSTQTGASSVVDPTWLWHQGMPHTWGSCGNVCW